MMCVFQLMFLCSDFCMILLQETAPFINPVLVTGARVESSNYVETMFLSRNYFTLE